MTVNLVSDSHDVENIHETAQERRHRQHAERVQRRGECRRRAFFGQIYKCLFFWRKYATDRIVADKKVKFASRCHNRLYNKKLYRMLDWWRRHASVTIEDRRSELVGSLEALTKFSKPHFDSDSEL